MKPFIFIFGFVFAFGHLNAETNVWQPSPGHMQVPIWPGAVPDAQPVPGPEAVLSNADWVVARKPFVFVVNVWRCICMRRAGMRSDCGGRSFQLRNGLR